MAIASCQAPGITPTSSPVGAGARLGPFRWSVETEPDTGWHVVSLACENDAEPRKRLRARICPEAGANLFSLSLGGVELLHQPATLRRLLEGGSGCPILYPTPNRVRDGRFVFEGREFRFGEPGAHFIHGLVRKEPWNYETPVFWDARLPAQGRATHVAFEAWIEFEPGSPRFERFPIRHSLRVRFSLHPESLWITFGVHNADSARLPFGFAVHPYFRVLGAREQTFLQVPAQAHMESTSDLLPTGVLQPLDGSPYDVRSPRSLAGLALDDVYWGMAPQGPAGFEARDAGVRVALKAGAEFTHLVVYTPAGKPYFCMENQTCSTDAHNLHAQGRSKEAHVLVAEPGQDVVGALSLRPAWIK